MRVTVTAFVALTILGAAIVSAQLIKKDPVDVFVDRQADFEAFSTYKWSKRQVPVENRANHIRFVRAINHEMEGRGYSQDTVRPHMEILFEVEVSKKLESQSKQAGRPYDSTNVRTNLAFGFYQEGKLRIIIYEADSFRRLWQAETKQRIEGPDKAEKQINAAVAKLFGEFPVPPKEEPSK